MASLAAGTAGPQPDLSEVALEVTDLTTEFYTRQGVLPAVRGFSLRLHRGEVLGLVGESGCGKSVTALSILRLIPPRVGRIVAGSVHYDGKDLLRLPEAQMRRLRGNEISMIFQEPMTALNPVLTIGQQIMEPLRLHQGLSPRESRERAIEVLRLVHIPAAERRIDAYPHELSGGMRQRAMIAMAVSCNPKVLIADEPTTALDVTIQAQILELLHELRQKLGTAIIMITHDLGVVAEMAHRVIVMYAGRKVEEASVDALFGAPRHPYTRGLLDAIPRLRFGKIEATHRSRLSAISGTVPSLSDLPSGCAFAPRCPRASDVCRQDAPALEADEAGHAVACWHAKVAVAA